MQFIGEHISIGLTGKFLIWISFISILFATVLYLLSCRKNQINFRKWRFYARHFYRLHFLLLLGALAILFYIIFNHYFEYDYVWQHSSKDLPLIYLLTSIWSGQEGSFILWIFFQGLTGIFLMHRSRDWEIPVMSIVSITQLILTSAILGINIFGITIGSNPFILLREISENAGNPFFNNPDYLQRISDGAGLNPMLFDLWMLIHPPILFLGYAAAVVPFAYAVAALFEKRFDEWLKPVIPWLSYTIFIFSIGILTGCAWAYKELTFGGFWSWDPIENLSLVTWLILVASLHIALISKIHKQYLSNTFLFIILTFVFVIYSAFLTRGNLLSNTSVHAFDNAGFNWHLLILLIISLCAILLLIIRLKKIPINTNNNFFSREFWMFAGCLIFLLSAFQIAFSTSIPLINNILGTNISPPINKIEYYNKWQLPYAALIGTFIAFTQLLKYGHNEKKAFIYKILLIIIISVAITILISIYSNVNKLSDFILIFTGLLVVVSSLYLFIRFIKKAKNKSSFISHLGLGIFLTGIVLCFSQRQNISENKISNITYIPYYSENIILQKGEQIFVGNYIVNYKNILINNNKVSYKIDFIKKYPSYSINFSMEPSIITNKNKGKLHVPAIKHFISHDIYTYIVHAEHPENTGNKNTDDFVIIKSIIFPYINVVWFGAIIMLLGLFISIINRSRYRSINTEIKNENGIAK